MQAQRLDADERAALVSQKAAIRTLKDRHAALQITYKAVLEDRDRLAKSAEAVRTAREEAEVARQRNREMSLQNSQLQGRLDTSDAKLASSQQRLEQVEKELAKRGERERQLEEEVERLREEARRRAIEAELGATQNWDIHVPVRGGFVAGEVLINSWDEDGDCYEGATEGVRCLHLTGRLNGERLTLRGKNTRKRCCTPLETPELHRQRQG